MYTSKMYSLLAINARLSIQKIFATPSVRFLIEMSIFSYYELFKHGKRMARDKGKVVKR